MSTSTATATSSRPRISAIGPTPRSSRIAHRCRWASRIELATGERFAQHVRLSSEGLQGAAETSAPTLRISGPLGHRLPRIGLGSTSDGAPLSSNELAAIGALGLDHLRADVHPVREDWEDDLRRGLREAEALGWSLEIALFLLDTGPVPHVAELLAQAPIDRVLVFVEGAQTATPDETNLAHLWAQYAKASAPLCPTPPSEAALISTSPN